MRRYFIAEEPSIVGEFDLFWARRDECLARRAKFVDVTGLGQCSSHIVTGEILSLYSGKVIEGWKRDGRDRIKPKTDSAKASLAELNRGIYPYEIARTILDRLRAAEPNGRGIPAKGVLMFWDDAAGSKMGGIGFRHIGGNSVVIIPSLGLAYEGLPGYREVREWEVLKMADDLAPVRQDAPGPENKEKK